MSLNIKDERVHDLVREVARRTGMSQTRAVEAALQRMLADLDDDPEAREARLRGIVEDFRARLTDSDRRLLTSDDLYDEDGLPA